jgi:hypothetical protein
MNILSVSVALVMQHAILSSVACLILPYLVTSFHNRCGFRENVTKHKMCVLSFTQLLSGIFLIPRGIW